MLINFNPTVTGGFVYEIMRDNEVVKQLEHCGINNEKDRHNLIKEILIAGLREYEVDINKIISSAKRIKSQ